MEKRLKAKLVSVSRLLIHHLQLGFYLCRNSILTLLS